MLFREISDPESLISLVSEIGFLPFFRNKIPGFSLEEHTPPDLWFVEGVDGPWEWKGPAAVSGACVYGKFFQNKAGFISRDWFPVLANYRRSGYDFDALWDDGLVLYKDRDLYDALARKGSLLSKELKSVCGYGKNGSGGFDTVITRLQMQTYVCISNFEYQTDRHGRPYGWGIARYSTPEHLFGEDFAEEAYQTPPEASLEQILKHLSALMPFADRDRLIRLIQ